MHMFSNRLNQLYRKNLPSVKKLAVRLNHTIQIKELSLNEYGNEINKCLSLKETDFVYKPLKNSGKLLVKLIAAPINPADLNIIQGKYGVLPKILPSPLGNEGVFEVCSVENESSEFKLGDWVLLNKLSLGSWRSHIYESESAFIKLPIKSDKYKFECATLSVNPMTAYRMLQDFKKLSPGDTVIQNGANSGVGQAIIQLGKLMKVNVVNIVRKRENQAELSEYLESLGSKYVYTEDMLRKSELMNDLWTQIPRPTLALNCVGGKATTDMIRLLDKNSIMVTYGGMSRQPLMLNTADFIFRDLKAFGFWLTRWKQANPVEHKKSINELCGLISNGSLKAPRCETFKLQDFNQAFARIATPFINSKCVFVP